MVLLRCAILGHLAVVPVSIALTPDSTAQELQRAVKKSVPLLASCSAAEFRLFLAKKWLPRDIVTLSDGTRLGAIMGDERWLQMDDPELLALMTPQVGSSVARVRCTTTNTDVDAAIADVRHEFLVPDLELLPQSKLLDSFCDDDEDEANTTIHVLVALLDEPFLSVPCSSAHVHREDQEQHGERRAERQEADDVLPLMRAIQLTNRQDIETPDELTTDIDSSDEAELEDAGEDQVNKDEFGGMMAAPTDDPQVLLALQQQYDAIPRVRYNVRPAQVNAAAIEALHAKIARFSTEYAIMSRGRQQFLCISFVLSAVCALFRENSHEPQLLSHVAIPGNALHVLAKFDFTMQRGHKHLGVVLANRKSSVLQRSTDNQHSLHAAMPQQALQQNWLGAEVLADLDRSAPEVFGIVTNYVDWVFLRYSDFKIHVHEATLQLGCGGVPMKASLAEIVGLAYEMLR